MSRDATAKSSPTAFDNDNDAELWDARTRRGRFRILVCPRTRHLVVFDPLAPNAQGSRGRFAWADLELAVARAEELSREAESKGEPNAHEQHGWKHDWTNPKTWERTV